MLNFALMRLESDPSAFFDEFYPHVFRFIASASGAPAADVDDLVQETLLNAWRSRDQFRGDASLVSWILAIARNRLRMRRRSERARAALDAALRALDLEEIPDDVVRSDEAAAAVRRALHALEPEPRDLLLRRYYQELPVKAIAAALGETEKAVESRLHRAREALRALLEKGGDHEL